MAVKRIPAPLALLLVAALLLRALIPSGWMPASGGGIEPCAGVREATAHHHERNPADSGKSDGDRQLCAFVTLAFAWTGPQAPQLAPPALAPALLPSPQLRAAVGRGLAAPPPPSTGPPSRA